MQYLLLLNDIKLAIMIALNTAIKINQSAFSEADMSDVHEFPVCIQLSLLAVKTKVTRLLGVTWPCSDII